MQIFSRKRGTRAELLDLQAEVTQARDAAQKRLDALLLARRDIELFSSLDDLAAHDASMGRERLEISRCDARLAKLAQDLQADEAEAEQAHRRGLYDVAKKTVGDGKTALRDYEKHASLAADALERYAACKARIDAANSQLPDGFEPLVDPESSNATPFARDENGFPLRLATAHVSVTERAVIPKLARNEFYFGEANVPEVYQR